MELRDLLEYFLAVVEGEERDFLAARRVAPPAAQPRRCRTRQARLEKASSGEPRHAW